MTASSDPRDAATPTPLPRRRGTRPPSVATPAGRRAGVAAFTMTALAALAETWALVCLGRAVGGLLTPSSTHLAGLLAQAGAAATACALLQAAAQATAWGSAATQEAALRRRVLDHLLDLGPAHTTSQRTGSTVSLLTDGAERVALYRQTFLAPTVAAALAVVLVSYVLLEPLDHVGAFFYVGMGGLANQRAIRQILATDRPLGAPDAPRAPADPGAAVRLDGVRASWGPEGPDVLHGVDLRVPTGQHLAVIGPSGSGKSTLMALLSGDLLPSGGTVRVAGTASSARTQDQVRAASALVAQTTWLFTGTIAHNLRLAAPGATEEQMWAALGTVGLDAEVRRMPRGLDTVLGEQGLGLSGGQAQRLSLARAILADRPLLLLDEPTSQVDLASEAAIVAAIPRAAAGRTVVTVSHRDGALVAADRLIEVRDGRILERTGPPAPAPASSSGSPGTAPAGPSGSLSASSSGSSAPGPAPFANPVPDPSQEA